MPARARSILGRAGGFAAGLSHPKTALFHLLFKTLAILVYMFGTMFSSSFVSSAASGEETGTSSSSARP